MSEETATEAVDTATPEVAEPAPETTTANIAEEVVPMEIDSGTTETSDGEGFLDFIGERMAEFENSPTESSGEDAAPEQESNEEAHTPPETETSEVMGEPSPTEEVDLVSEFPTADTLGDVLDSKASAKWGELRSELAEARSRAQELESQIGEAPQDTYHPLEEQLHEARGLIDHYEQELSVSRVEVSPEYKQSVEAPLQNIMDAATSLAERNELDPNVVIDVFSSRSVEQQNKELEHLTENMGDRDKMSLYRMVDDAQAIFAYDTELKEHAAEAAAQLDHQNEAYEQEALNEYSLSARNSVNKVYDKFESVLPELKGADLGELRQKALDESFLDLGVEHQAYAVSAGTMLPPIVQALHARDSRIVELEKQLSSYQKATPKAAESGGGVQVTPADTSAKDDMDFMQAITSRMGA